MNANISLHIELLNFIKGLLKHPTHHIIGGRAELCKNRSVCRLAVELLEDFDYMFKNQLNLQLNTFFGEL